MRGALGELTWLAVRLRPDLCAPCSLLQQRVTKAVVSDLVEVYKLIATARDFASAKPNTANPRCLRLRCAHGLMPSGQLRLRRRARPVSHRGQLQTFAKRRVGPYRASGRNGRLPPLDDMHVDGGGVLAVLPGGGCGMDIANAFDNLSGQQASLRPHAWRSTYCARQASCDRDVAGEEGDRRHGMYSNPYVAHGMQKSSWSRDVSLRVSRSSAVGSLLPHPPPVVLWLWSGHCGLHEVYGLFIEGL